MQCHLIDGGMRLACYACWDADDDDNDEFDGFAVAPMVSDFAVVILHSIRLHCFDYYYYYYYSL